MSMSGSVRSAVIWSSLAYILWLAYHIATAPPLSEPTAAAKAFTVAGGIILGIANPKAWVGDFRSLRQYPFRGRRDDGRCGQDRGADRE